MGTDNGIWDRIKLIEFPVYFGDDQRDPELKAKLRAEASGWLNWLVEGAFQWYKHGLQVPACVKQATQQYRNDQNVVGQFIEERCKQEPGTWVSQPELYRAYQFWAERSGEYVMGKVEFNERIGTLFEEGRTGTKGRFWKGLRLDIAGELSEEKQAELSRACGW